MTPWVRRLLVANVVMFGLQVLAPWVESALIFVPRLVLLRPWSVVTYMFLHGGVMHLLFNMLGLFFFGPRVEQRLGERRFVQLYFIAGLSGALLSFAMAPRAAIIGASAGVFGVMMAFAMFWPRERIYIWGIVPVEARLLVVLTTLFALYAGFTGSTGGVADFAHLGGYAGAWLFLWALDNYSPARRFRAKATAVAPGAARALATNLKGLNLEGVHALSKEEVNRILDKISAEGLGSLTPQERLFLSNFVPPDDRKAWTS